MKLSVVIPCYNEENRLGSTLKRIKKYLDKKKYKYELIVVDDGSTDSTTKIAEKHKAKVLKNHTNKGKGHSFKKGFLAAKKDYVLLTDADLSTPIEDLEKFLPHLNYDIIIGSRKKPASDVKVRQPFYRVLAGNIFPLIVNILVLGDIRDTQCGFKLFKRKKCLNAVKKMTLDGFAFDVELLCIAKNQNLSVKEKGVTWHNEKNSRLLLVKHSAEMFFDLLKIKINDMLGKY